MSKVWKAIPGTGGAYEASDAGEIRSLPRTIFKMGRWGAVVSVALAGKIIKPWRDSNGYAAVRICVGGKQKAVNVHRLVAMAFHGERDGMDVNHIDGDKANNAASNLEWCTRAENMQHARAVGLVAAVRAVIAKPKAGGDVLKFASSKDAALALGGLGKWGNIKSALCGQVPSAYGYHWQYDSQA
ncbi:MAG: Pectobacterium phage phiTE [Pseudomonadota bacterium]|jgi:hypothetical protein